MLQAIHKETGKLVSAFQIIKDLSWGGRKKDIFIAPAHEIGNWEELDSKGIKEVEVTFIENYLRDGSPVIDHFRIVTEGAIYSNINESEEHKVAKKTIYQWAWDDSIILKNYSGKKLSEFGISDIRLEKGFGHMRADVLVDFKGRHETLGRGIAFEIQLSPQNKDRTMFRSYDRAAQDYSVVWIWAQDLKDNKKEFVVEPVYDCIRKLKEQLTKETSLFLGDISQKAEIKVMEIKQEINSALGKLKESSINEIENRNKASKDLLSKAETYYGWASAKINDMENKINTQLNSIVGEEVNLKIKGSIKLLDIDKIVSEGLEQYAKKVKDTIDNLNVLDIYKEQLILSFKCSKCNKYFPYANSLCVYKNKKLYCYQCSSEVKELGEKRQDNNKIH